MNPAVHFQRSFGRKGHFEEEGVLWAKTNTFLSLHLTIGGGICNKVEIIKLIYLDRGRNVFLEAALTSVPKKFVPISLYQSEVVLQLKIQFFSVFFSNDLPPLLGRIPCKNKSLFVRNAFYIGSPESSQTSPEISWIRQSILDAFDARASIWQRIGGPSATHIQLRRAWNARVCGFVGAVRHFHSGYECRVLIFVENFHKWMRSCDAQPTHLV